MRAASKQQQKGRTDRPKQASKLVSQNTQVLVLKQARLSFACVLDDPDSQFTERVYLKLYQ